jgi:hypothetical protein
VLYVKDVEMVLLLIFLKEQQIVAKLHW